MFETHVMHSYQMVLFVKSGSIRADELSVAVRSSMQIGEFEPVLLPDQPGMPPEFPRLHINTSEGYRLTMSRARIELVCDLPLGLDETEVVAFKENCRLLASVLEGKNFSLSRVGLVKSWFSAMDDAAVQVLEALTSIEPQKVSDVSLSVTRKCRLGEWGVNSLFNFVNGKNYLGQEGVMVVRDVNTDQNLQLEIGCAVIPEIIELFDAELSIKSVQDFIVRR